MAQKFLKFLIMCPFLLGEGLGRGTPRSKRRGWGEELPEDLHPDHKQTTPLSLRDISPKRGENTCFLKITKWLRFSPASGGLPEGRGYNLKPETLKLFIHCM